MTEWWQDEIVAQRHSTWALHQQMQELHETLRKQSYELGEAQAELRRHHNDFGRIRREVNAGLDHEDPYTLAEALMTIRGVVG